MKLRLARRIITVVLMIILALSVTQGKNYTYMERPVADEIAAGIEETADDRNVSLENDANTEPETDIEGYTEFEEPENNNMTVDLIIFMGQSNMAGQGNASRAPALIEGAGYEFRAAYDPTRLYPIQEPFGLESDYEVEIANRTEMRGSMVTSFVNSYYSLTGVPVVGVSSTEGGTVVSEWQPGSERLETSITRYNMAKEWLQENGYTIRHQFMVWLQGETDGDMQTDPKDYQHLWYQTVGAMLDQGIEKCCVIRLGDRGDGADSFDGIIEIQTKVAMYDENFVMISTLSNGFYEAGLLEDVVHISQEGLNWLGEDAGMHLAYYVTTSEEPTMYDPFYDNVYVPADKAG